MFKKLFFFLFLFSFFLNCIEININPEKYEKMNVLIGLIKADPYLTKIAQKMKADFEFGGQFNVKIEQIDHVSKKNDITKLESAGYPIIIFLSSVFKNEKIGIQWRIYDSMQASMLKGKQVFSNNEKDVAHVLSDQIWPELAGQESCFSSVIAACKKTSINKKKNYTYIYILHPSEVISKLSKPILIINEPTICLSPRWNHNKALLYYSKHTPSNVRLMSIDLNKNKSIVANFDGLNLTPAFSDDNKIILSLTINGKGRICQYIYDEKKGKGIFSPLTSKKIHAISPSFINNENILFCSIDKSNKSRVSVLNLKSGDIEYLTKPYEYCTSPAYCKKNNKIVYCKRVNGLLQVFIYDLENKDHKQLTFDKGDKESCSWSPCSNYLTFSVEYNDASRIAVFNMQNNKMKLLTPENEWWSSPCWSPVYHEIPFI